MNNRFVDKLLQVIVFDSEELNEENSFCREKLSFMSGSVVSGNIASVNGGGLYNYDGTLSFEGVEVSGNKAKNEGGGFYLQSGLTTFRSVTIAGNIAGDLLEGNAGTGGGVYSEESFTAVDTLIVDNYRLDGYESNVYPVNEASITGENSVFSTADAPEFISGPSYSAGWTSDLWKSFDLRLTPADIDRFGDIGAYIVSYESDAISFDLSNTEARQSRSSGTVIGNFYGDETYSYTFVAGEGSDDNGLFTLSDGVLVNGLLTDAVVMDKANLAGTYSIRVRATDASGYWSEKVFSIDIIETIVVFTVTDAGDVAEQVYDAATGTMVANPEFSITDTASMTLREAVAAVNALSAEGKQGTIVFDSSLSDESGNVSITLSYGPVTITNSLYINNADMSDQVATLAAWTPTVSIICGADVLYSADNPSLGSYNPDGDLFIVDSAAGDVAFNGIELVGRKETTAVTVVNDGTPTEGVYTGAITSGEVAKENTYLTQKELLTVTMADDIINPYDGLISLREAVEVYSQAGASNTVKFLYSLRDEILTLDATIVVTNNIFLDGDDVMTIQPSDSFSGDYLFSVHEGAVLKVENINFDGVDMVGLIYNAGTLTMFGDNTLRNGLADNGGAIYNLGGATLTHVVLNHNSAAYNGGAIYNLGALTVNGSTIFNDNAAANKGGAIYHGLNATAISISVTYEGNEAGFAGGAVYNLGSLQSGSNLYQSNCATYASAIYDGGVILGWADSLIDNIALADVNPKYNPTSPSWFWNDKVSYLSGAVYIRGDEALSLTPDYSSYRPDGEISGNLAGTEHGGEGHRVTHIDYDLETKGADDGTVISVSGDGTGLIVNAGSVVTFNAGTITGFNDSGIKNSGQLSVNNSQIAGNIGNLGGGIYSDGDLTVTETSVSGNLALDKFDESGALISAAAGGIYVAANSQAHLTNVTVAGNTVQSGVVADGGAGLVALGTVDADNTLVVQNYIAADDGMEEMNVTGAGYDTASSVRSIIAEGAAVEFDTIADFESFGDGAVWSFDLWKDWNLTSSSAAVVDQGVDSVAVFSDGSTVQWDLSGLARFGGNSVDIGAYEYQSVSPLTLSNNRFQQDYVGYVGDVSVLYPSSYIGTDNLPVDYTYSFVLDDQAANPDGVTLSNDRFTLTENGELSVIEPGLAPGYYYIGVRADSVDPMTGAYNTEVFTIIVTETPSTVVTTTVDVVDVTDGLISLREAIEVYGGGRYGFVGNDTVTFNLSDETGYTFELASSIRFTVDLEVDGLDYTVRSDDGSFVNLITISAADGMTDELFWVNGNTVGIEGIGFDGGATALVTGSHSFVTVSDSTFENFTDTAIKDSGSLVIEDSVVRHNAGSEYGAIVNLAGAMTIRGTDIVENTSALGGGGVVNYGSLFLGNSNVESNAAQNGDGGGVLNYGVLTVFSSSLSGNTATGAGGGLAHKPTAENVSSRLTLINAIASANQANNGGGIYITGINSQLTNCTIVGNIGTSSDVPLGAGINVDLSAEQAAVASVNLYNTIVAGRRRQTRSRRDPVASVNLYNTIVAANYNSVLADQDNICPTDSGIYNSVNCLVDGTVPEFKNFAVSSYEDLVNSSESWQEWDLSLAASDTAAHDQGDTELAVSYDGTRLSRDFNGDARMMGESVDIGAIEYSVKLIVTTVEDEFDYTEGAYLVDGHVSADIIDGSDDDGVMRTDIETVGTGLSLREAIYWVEQEDLKDVVIMFHDRIAGGTITLSAEYGDLDVTENIVISAASVYDNAAQENGMTVSGNDATRLFNVADSASLSISSLNLTAGNAGTDNGGAFLVGTNATLDIIDSVLTNNRANNGGAIYALGGSDVQIDDSYVGANTARYNGGAIYTTGDLAVRWSDFVGNQTQTAASSVGGAIAVFGGGSLLVEAGSFRENLSARNAGAIYINCSSDALASIIYNGTEFIENHSNWTSGAVMLNAGTLAVSQVTFTDNSADNYAGALYTKGRLVLSESTLTGNSASVYGGSIYVYGAVSNLLVSKTDFVSNKALHGGAIAICGGGTATISDQTSFSYNESESYGGAIGNWGTLTVNEADFIGNKSTRIEGNTNNGGAIGNASGAVATVTYSRFVENSAEYGGAVHNAGTIDIYGCEFVGNKALENGGAISNQNNISVLNFITVQSEGEDMLMTTFENNSANGYGGAILNGGTILVNDADSDSPFVYFKNNKAGDGKNDAQLRGSAVCENQYSESNLTEDNVTLDNAFEAGDADAVIQAIWAARYQTSTTVLNSLAVESLELNESQTLMLDLNNDGEYLAYDAETMTLADLGLTVGNYEISLKVVDDNGVESQTSSLILSVSGVELPSVEFIKNEQLGGRIALLRLSAISLNDYVIEKWVIHWGDGQTSEYDSVTNVLLANHYYAQNGDYDITFETVNGEGVGAGMTRFIATHTVSAPAIVAVQEAVPTVEETPVVEEAPEIAEVFVKEEPVAILEAEPITLTVQNILPELAVVVENSYLDESDLVDSALADLVYLDAEDATEQEEGIAVGTAMAESIAVLDLVEPEQWDFDFVNEETADDYISQESQIDPEKYLLLNL